MDDRSRSRRVASPVSADVVAVAPVVRVRAARVISITVITVFFFFFLFSFFLRFLSPSGAARASEWILPPNGQFSSVRSRVVSLVRSGRSVGRRTRPRRSSHGNFIRRVSRDAGGIFSYDFSGFEVPHAKQWERRREFGIPVSI